MTSQVTYPLGLAITLTSLAKSMIQISEFTEWMSTLSSKGLATESQGEEEPKPRLELDTESRKTKLWRGSRITSKSKSWRSENGKRSWRENWKINRLQKMWEKERHDQKTWPKTMQTMLQRQG